MKNYRRGLTLVFTTAFISGFSIWLNAFGVKGIEPNLFAGLKNLLVGLIICAGIVFAREWKSILALTKKDWLMLIIIGIIGGGIPFILFFNGLALTSAAKAGFIHKTLFLYASLFAVIFLKEKITRTVVVGLGALALGQVILADSVHIELTFGDFLILAATLFWAVEIILAKRLLRNVAPNIVAGSRMLFGGICIWVYMLFVGQWQQIFFLTGSEINWVIITTVLLLGYVMTFYHGLKYVPAHVATSILALGAPVTLLLSALFQNKTISMSELGSVVIMALACGIISRMVTEKHNVLRYVPEKDNL